MQRPIKDVLAGLTFVCFGAAFAVGALQYEVGDPTRMGPGFYPLAVGLLLVVLGVVIAIRPALDGDPGPLTPPRWRATGLIIGSIIVFGLAVRPLGLVPSLFITTLLASFASERATLPMAVVLAAGLTALSIGIFVGALSLRLPLFGPLVPRL